MDINVITPIFQVVVLIFSAVAHEYMHGWMAHRLGDNTAEAAGRLTLNPLAHLEWFGSFFLPLVMILTKMSFVFGWAKPVPYNPYNLRDQKYGEAKVALAGPLTNFIVALFFGLFLRFWPISSLTFAGFIVIIIYTNLVLMLFNLVPLPPLDGSKILAAFLPAQLRVRYLSAERLGFILVIVFVMLAGDLLIPVVESLFKVIVGS
jgi:Zn-dependent protease